MKIRIKPLSINEAFQGRRFKTKVYDSYCEELVYILPKMKIPEGPLALKITFGFSNKGADIDNPTKPFIDVLQEAYCFNDKLIYKLDITKEIVEKGREFIDFELSPYVA
jgi:Holliday junction resolvase RusA-like endonuclease